MEIVWAQAQLLHSELNDALLHDTMLIIVSVVIIFGFLWLLLDSFFLAVAAIITILLSMGSGYFLYRIVFQVCVCVRMQVCVCLAASSRAHAGESACTNEKEFATASFSFPSVHGLIMRLCAPKSALSRANDPIPLTHMRAHTDLLLRCYLVVFV